MIQSHNIDQNIKSSSSDKQHKTRNLFSMGLFIVIILANIVFFIYIFIHSDISKISRLNFPANYKGQICFLNFTNTFPFIYIDLEQNIPTYRCVSECPASWNQFTIKDSQNNILASSFPQQHINLQLGGVCWSLAKQKMIKEVNLLSQLLQKQNILISIKNIFLIILFSFGLSTLLLIYNSLSSNKISIILPILFAGVFIIITSYLAYIKYANYQMPIIIFFTFLLIIYTLNIWKFKDQLVQFMDYQSIFSQRYQKGNETVCYKNMLSFGIIILFNVLNVLFIIVILFQYIFLISTQQLQLSPNNLYYHVNKTGWKYGVLFLQWYLISSIIFQLYSLIMTEIGYRVNLGQNVSFQSLNCHNIYLLTQFSTILTLGALPIKLIQFLKPNGAILVQNDEYTCCNRITRFSYCCCGGLINLFHKFTFNPYLINTMDTSHHDLLQSLTTVQHVYHQKYPTLDRCSQWLYRLSNYIIISLVSIILLDILSAQGQQVLGLWRLLLFYIIIVIFSNEVSKININFWSLYVEVTQFIQISHQLTKK